MTHINYFKSTYRNLSRFEQIILQICSVIFDRSDTSTILRCLYSVKLSTHITLSEYPRQIEKCFQHLSELDLLQPDHVCTRKYVELISRQAIQEENFKIIADAVQNELPPRKLSLTGTDPVTSIRDLRINLYNDDVDKFHKQLVDLLGEQRTISTISVHPMVTICNNPFDPLWFASLPVHIQFLAIHEIIKYSILVLDPLDNLINYLISNDAESDQNLLSYPSFLYLLISALLLQGNIKKAQYLIKENSADLDSLGLKGWLQFIQGRNSESIRLYNDDLTLLRKLNNQDDAYFTGFEGVLFCLALIKSNDPGNLIRVNKITQMMKNHQNNIFSSSYSELNLLIQPEKSIDPDLLSPPYPHKNPANSIHALFMAKVLSIKKGRMSAALEIVVSNYFETASKHHYEWIAMEYAEILHKTTGREDYRDFALDIQKKKKIISISDVVKHKERWQHALDDLDKLNILLADQSLVGTQRMVWQIKADNNAELIEITPKEQRLSSNGSWSKGRTVSTKRLFHLEDLDYLSDQDKKICAAIKRKKTSTGSIIYYFQEKQALYSMAGHKNVYLTDMPHIHLDISKAEPELRVSKENNKIVLKFFPTQTTDNIRVVRENFTRFKIISISEEQRKIAEIIGPYGLTIPKRAKKKILHTIGKTAAHINVYSDLVGIETPHQKIISDSRIYLQIIPSGSGFKIGIYVRPFDSKGPYFKPGVGPATIFSEINNQLLQTTRDLSLENKYALLLDEHCQPLPLHEEGEWEWIIPTPNGCLEFLHAIYDFDNIILEWPKGEKFKLVNSVGTEHCQLKIKKNNNWFEIEGSLQLDETEVLSIMDLLRLVRESGSRFIQLKENDFYALTKELYNSIERVELCSQENNGRLELLPIAAKSLENIKDEGLDVEIDQAWNTQLKRIKNASRLQPQVPSTIQGVLRDYQQQGFRWMMRLAHWTTGACLADDMGIGKTIQALAVILSRSSKGPSLVVAPTSVCLNWQDEINRFTPTLFSSSFNGSDRKSLLNKLGPFEVFITSYGLLQQVPELSEVDWQVIVLDEGHAIKNANTKRSAAAMKLKSEFRIVTTGTPIENNLGELWNLFRFINPGLLGTLKQFNRRFASPIEKEKNRDKRNKLRKLISPFILRRLKSQVLEELPSRTEVNLYVDFSEEETNFYEALRRQSLQKINANNNKGQLRIRILAEIMQLRRACCSPKLIHPESKILSSKLILFEKTIDELLVNKHKTLVFSQFVGHLSIIREFLNRKNIKYHYLDGSTPPRVRKMRIDAFQSGDGDVFLISLRAGGVGLNLTAANYVIHMDPWWNPAVEDQASDRAHRIGQEQPVTIYKLITRNTIEEKIIMLHQQKRDLANKLLEGTDIGDKISAEDLLILLQES